MQEIIVKLVDLRIRESLYIYDKSDGELAYRRTRERKVVTQTQEMICS